ncbi:MAG: hypothetical protein II103_01505 [Treponema sp.]|nr:hypothetical protein [Treponema sp.]
MVQFYFLSVLINIIAGLILVYGMNLCEKNDLIPSSAKSTDFSEDIDDEDPFADIEAPASSPAPSAQDQAANTAILKGVNNPVFRLVIGVLAVFIGFMKILSVFSGDLPIIGDFLPAFAGILGGASMLIEYFESSSDSIYIPDNIQTIFIDSRKYIGVICVAAGVLHFVFPKVILL